MSQSSALEVQARAESSEAMDTQEDNEFKASLTYSLDLVSNNNNRNI